MEAAFMNQSTRQQLLSTWQKPKRMRRKRQDTTMAFIKPSRLGNSKRHRRKGKQQKYGFILVV